MNTTHRSVTPAAQLAQVTQASQQLFTATGASEHRAVPLFAPRGVQYQPCEADTLLLLSVEGSSVCVGALSAGTPPGEAPLDPGELLLSTPGGARLWLKANGDIVLNGVTITREGQILPVG